jgi:alkanesulfonate monooxygenase SsuD/methylene tetrahydromethanopterin reductase-like flavin-dependent oxidoreductase (luciferase family)
MQIGFNLPNSGPLSAVADMTRIASEGEAMGFDYLTLTDHVVLPNTKVPGYPYSESGQFYEDAPLERHEQIVGMTWIAARTSRIRRPCSPPRCWRHSMCCRAGGWSSASARAG